MLTVVEGFQSRMCERIRDCTYRLMGCNNSLFAIS
ncbi:hypothetical protein C7459_10794 [Tumebacillus permanentifrigoris]|uniref:Uncharacterized protein n=1 Tax=Tumebacillus permanentifrigoris TaxID=378543 RepID=A0A316D8W5_9BACL|nr:hypothetical protein C7459_10794 [Tumebacillus permanentifrigoris]